MQCVIIGIIAARPGCIRIRVSREISFGPNTKPASRISESREAAASSSACSTARAVSIIAQTRIDVSALISLRRSAMAVEILDAGNLRHQNAVGPRLAGHGDVIDPPWRIQRVDADQDLALAEAPGGDRLRDLVARHRLGVRRHGILEVEDDAVGGQIAGLFQRPRIRSGHEQQAAARTDHGLVPLADFEPHAITFRHGRPKGLFRPAAYG